MYRFDNRENYDWVSSVEINGETRRSTYNHNFYVNYKTGQIVLEGCDDCDCFDYMMYDGEKWEDLGCIFSVSGLFSDSDDIVVEEDGAVLLYES